jgi:hypothetical protein
MKMTSKVTRIKFLCSINDDTFEEVMAYNDIISYIESEEENNTIWKFKRITAHEGPITRRHSNWKGSTYNVMVEWEDGSVTAEPLAIVAADDPVSCAIYAKKNDLLEAPGWKRFKGIAKRQKKFLRMSNQASQAEILPIGSKVQIRLQSTTRLWARHSA